MSRHPRIRSACVVLLLATLLIATAGAHSARARADGVDRPAIRVEAGTPTVERASHGGLDVDLLGPPTGGALDAVATTGTPDIGERFARLAADLGAVELGVPLAAALLRASDVGDGSPLANDNRRRVYGAVAASPGTHIAAIVDATGVPRSTVRYHLRVLEDAALVVGAHVGGRHRFAAEDVDLQVAAALRDEPTRSVADAISRYEPVSVTGLAAELDRAKSTVSHHVDRLEDAGLVDRQRDGVRVLLRVRPEGRDLVEDIAVDTDPVGAAAGLSTE